MDALLIGLIKDVLMDAVKIIGPAAIAAFATYKATKIQYDFKLREVFSANSYEARGKLFDYYKGRLDKLAESQAGLNSALMSVLGSSFALGEESGENPLLGIMEVCIRTIPLDVSITEREMRGAWLANTDEYKRLLDYKSEVPSLKANGNYASIKDDVYKLIEIYAHLQSCNHLLMEGQMKKVFAIYMDDKGGAA